MIQTYTSIFRRYADARPGLRLLAVEDAALPVSVLRTDVLVQDRRSLPAIDEFLLRFTETGVNTIKDIARYMGLPSDLLLDAAVRQTSAGNLMRQDSARFVLTAQGLASSRELTATQPELKEIAFVFDRLAWRPVAYQQSTLLRRREATQRGLTLVPAAANAAIGVTDIKITDLNRIVPGRRATILRVNRLAGRRHLWAPAKLLVFGDSTSQELELAVYVDDEISPAHESALQATAAATQLRMAVAPAPFIPDPRFGMNAPPGAEQSDVQSIEHLDHLLEAALRSRNRLLIASQSARSDVVDEQFCRYLRERARAGTDVTIIIGDDSLVDQRAAERLRTLSRTEPNVTVSYANLSGTSYLISDDVTIETTFDWLSGGRTGSEYSWRVGRRTQSTVYADETESRLPLSIARSPSSRSKTSS